MGDTNSARVFDFTYAVEADALPTDEVIDLYFPLPVQDDRQELLDETLQSSHPGKVMQEAAHGNRYYHVQRLAGDDSPVITSFTWRVRREEAKATAAPDADGQTLATYLAPNRLVPVGHEVLEPILKEIHALRKSGSPADTSRAIYDWIVDNVEYKKVGTGWGNGDTFWACSERYGNCTDFHALFIALARTEGIPARFEIGFPVPMDKESGDIGGYHCWVQFYLPESGWVPIDASEAAKHPEMRELYYGSHPANRVHFSTGRDLLLSSATQTQPLNYFIYPYVEVAGKPWAKKVAAQFSFADVQPQGAL